MLQLDPANREAGGRPSHGNASACCFLRADDSCSESSVYSQKFALLPMALSHTAFCSTQERFWMGREQGRLLVSWSRTSLVHKAVFTCALHGKSNQLEQLPYGKVASISIIVAEQKAWHDSQFNGSQSWYFSPRYTFQWMLQRSFHALNGQSSHEKRRLNRYP